MSVFNRFLPLSAVCLAMAASVGSAATLDQGQIYDTDGRVILEEGVFFGQTITPGITGTLVGLEVLYEEGVVAPIQFSIFGGTSPDPGALLYSERIDAPIFLKDEESPFVFRWDLTGEDLFFDAGTPFMFGFMAESGGVEWSASDPPDYPGGELAAYIGGLPFAIDGAGDLAFRTYVAPVPLPSAAVFLMTGLLGAGALRARRQRSA